MKWLQRIKKYAYDIVLNKFSRRYKVCKVNESTTAPLKEKCVYIVSEDGFEEHAELLCPCDCKNVLYLNLIPDEKPCWKVIIHKKNLVSLHPSVWRKVGCKSHFWLKEGKVYWC